MTLYASSAHQGHVNGLFRSAGALGRAMGPLFASILYWRLGAPVTYAITLGLMLAATMVALTLPKLSTAER